MGFSTTIPAFPVQDVGAAAAFYRDRLGFAVAFEDQGFAKLIRDDAELHLWAAFDTSWKQRTRFAEEPICSGAESFIAGTASCRIQVDDADELYAEMRDASVLHPADRGSAQSTDWNTREFAVLDLDGNLLTFFHRTPPRESRDDNGAAESDDVDIVRQVFEAVGRRDFETVAELLDADVQWYGAGAEEGHDGCHSRLEAIAFIREALQRGTRMTVHRVIGVHDRVLVELQATERDDEPGDTHGQLITVRDGKILEVVVYPTLAEAIAAAT